MTETTNTPKIRLTISYPNGETQRIAFSEQSEFSIPTEGGGALQYLPPLTLEDTGQTEPTLTEATSEHG